MPLNGSVKPLIFIHTSTYCDYVNVSHASHSLLISGSLFLPISLNYCWLKRTKTKNPKDGKNTSSNKAFK